MILRFDEICLLWSEYELIFNRYFFILYMKIYEIFT